MRAAQAQFDPQYQRHLKHLKLKGLQPKTIDAYLFSHKALAKVFRAKMLAGIEAAGLTLPCRHPEKWVVDCTSVGTGRTALIYLGRYLYRGVIVFLDAGLAWKR